MNSNPNLFWGSTNDTFYGVQTGSVGGTTGTLSYELLRHVSDIVFGNAVMIPPKLDWWMEIDEEF